MTQWQALVWTLACEVPVTLYLARKKPFRRALPAAGASLLTHPVAWKAAVFLSPSQYTAGLWIIEICVVLVEALWLKLWLRVTHAQALAWSLLANAASFALGAILLT